MTRSGCPSATCAERPSVKSSKRRISLTTPASAADPTRLRNCWVTISVRGVGCKPGEASTTRTRRPACAISFAAYKPAAEPPTTTTCSVLVAAGLFSSLDTRPFCLNRPRDSIPASWEFLRRSAGSPRLLLQFVRPSDVALTGLPSCSRLDECKSIANRCTRTKNSRLLKQNFKRTKVHSCCNLGLCNLTFVWGALEKHDARQEERSSNRRCKQGVARGKVAYAYACADTHGSERIHREYRAALAQPQIRQAV